MNYWQIGCGSYGRDYAHEFIRLGRALVGREPKMFETMKQVQPGDRVLAKRGISEVVAAGVVVARNGKHLAESDDAWLWDFDGWDLQVHCFVEWHVPGKPIPADGLVRSTIQGVHHQGLHALADKIIAEVPATEPELLEPTGARTVPDDEILAFLVREGLRPGAAEELTSALRRIRSLARYYYDEGQWDVVREHETRTFLTMPLLLALGWAEQQIKIELPVGGNQRADIACFRRPYRVDGNGNTNDGDCVLILETKSFSQGLTYTREQAVRYAEHFPNCPVIVATNGYCYKTYPRQKDGSFAERSAAYLNLLRPRVSHPLDPEVKGCMETLQLLLPSFGA